MKRVLQYVLTAMLVMGSCFFAQTTEINGDTISEITYSQTKVKKEKSVSKDTEVGDIITFGNYEQDGDTSNGKESIEWIVLDKKDDKVLLISKYGLDAQPYNELREDVTWETCTLRKWLNSTFINEAFNKQEQNVIAAVTVTADKNPYHDTDPGNDTKDKIFLLSIQEVKKYFSSEEDMHVYATQYAIDNGALVIHSNGCSPWLVRSPGKNSKCVPYINYIGSFFYGGDFVDYVDSVVRPALWLEIK